MTIRKGLLLPPLRAVGPVDGPGISRNSAEHVPGRAGTEGNITGDGDDAFRTLIVLDVQLAAVLGHRERRTGPFASLRIWSAAIGARETGRRCRLCGHEQCKRRYCTREQNRLLQHNGLLVFLRAPSNACDSPQPLGNLTRRMSLAVQTLVSGTFAASGSRRWRLPSLR